MTTETTIGTAHWYKFPGRLAQTGFFEEGELNPDTVQRTFSNIVKGYTTVIGYLTAGGLEPVGSGTFVRGADGQFGVLTAGHVVGAIEGRNRMLRGQGIEGQSRLRVSQGIEAVEWVPIGAPRLEACGQDNDRQEGPDIGWIPLSPQEAKDLEDKRAVFYNMAKPREGFPPPFSRIGVVLGFLRATSRPEDKRLGFHATFTGEPSDLPADAGGWDYVEYGLDSDEPELPSSHKGVSGSGVWRIDLPNDGTRQKEVVLVGVAFSEGTEEDRKLITHGEKSVRMFLDGLGRAAANGRQ